MKLETFMSLERCRKTGTLNDSELTSISSHLLKAENSTLDSIDSYKKLHFADLGTILKDTIEHGQETQNMIGQLTSLGFEVHDSLAFIPETLSVEKKLRT